MATLSVNEIQPDEADVSIAVDALPHVKHYLATHPSQATVRLIVDNANES